MFLVRNAFACLLQFSDDAHWLFSVKLQLLQTLPPRGWILVISSTLLILICHQKLRTTCIELAELVGAERPVSQPRSSTKVRTKLHYWIWNIFSRRHGRESPRFWWCWMTRENRMAEKAVAVPSVAAWATPLSTVQKSTKMRDVLRAATKMPLRLEEATEGTGSRGHYMHSSGVLNIQVPYSIGTRQMESLVFVTLMLQLLLPQIIRCFALLVNSLTA